MSSEIDSIRTGYDDLHLSPEDIASDRGLDIVAVKAALMQCSSKYRKDVGSSGKEENPLDFTNDDLRMVNNEIRNLAIFGEDEHIRLKAAMYIRDDKKGRKEVVKVIAGNNTFNILSFNESIQRARELSKNRNSMVTTNI